MLDLRKDPVLQCLTQLSELDINSLLLYFQIRRFGEKTVALLESYVQFYQSETALPAKNVIGKASYVEKHRVKTGVLEYLAEKTSFRKPELEQIGKEANVFFTLKEYEKSLEKLMEGLAIIFREERFAEFQHFYEVAGAAAKLVDRDSWVLERYKAMRPKFDRFMEGYALWLEIIRLWERYGVVFIEKKEVDGTLDMELLTKLETGIESIITPVTTFRPLVQYYHAMSLIKMAQEDFHAVRTYNNKVLEILESRPYLEEYFPELRARKLYQSLTTYLELGNKHVASGLLEKLRMGCELLKVEYTWTFILGSTFYAEKFWNHEANRMAERFWNKYEDEIKINVEPKHIVNILFHLIRNKVLFCQYNRIGVFYNKIFEYSRIEIKKEFQVYAKIFEIIQAWDFGEFALLKRLTKNCKAMLNRFEGVEKLPQAAIIVGFFSSLRSNLLPESESILIDKTRMELKSLELKLKPELKIINFEFILGERQTRLETIQNSYAS